MVRAPWYSLLIALFVMQFFDKRFRRLFIVIAVVAAIVLGLAWNRVSESQVAARLNDETSTYQGREDRWLTGLNMWRAQPIGGWGFNRFKQHGWRFRVEGTHQRMQAPENDYLIVMIGGGLIALVPYLAILLTPLLTSIRLAAKAKSFRKKKLPWTGFVKVETLGVVCAEIVCYLVYSFSAANVSAGTKLILFAVAGAVVGTHEHLLRRPDESPALADDEGSSNLAAQQLTVQGQTLNA
jgi:O-antigen ligase